MAQHSFPPRSEELNTESDVEQKLLFPLLSGTVPVGMGIPTPCIFTKSDIRQLTIGKGGTGKLYYPDYAVAVLGMPIVIVEAKAPSETNLGEAAREARLYSIELNAKYPASVNPCRFCIVSNGLKTEVRMWDTDDVLAEFTLENIHASSPLFGKFIDCLNWSKIERIATETHSKFRSKRFVRPLNLIGGTSMRDERIEYNNFGKLLTSKFQNLFNPNSWADRKRIVRDAYVPSRRRSRYVDEIDGIIRSSAPPKIKEAQLIDDTSQPQELVSRLAVPNELKNKILLLIGAVGAGKSTFVDYLQEVALPAEVQSHLAWVRLDLNEAPVSPSEIYSWCREQLMQGIRATSEDLDIVSPDGVRKLYKPEVAEFDSLEGALFDRDSEQYRARFADLVKSLRNDTSKTLRAMERYLCTGRGRLLVVGLDNCDKRDRDEQLLMFEVAKWIQQQVRCLVILPLRQETFENHRNEPPLDTALKDLIFRIEPPPFQEVLTERLKLVMSAARAQLKNSDFSYQMGQAKVEFSPDNIEKYLRLMMRSLFEYEHYGRKIIIGLAGWDRRRAFEIFLEFCRSGYIAEEEIFRSQATGEQLTFGQGVIARILLRTDRRFYDSDRSYVKNLFQCNPAAGSPDHFLRYNILSWLRHRYKVLGPSGLKGYHRLGDLAKDLIAHGSALEEVVEECQYLAKAKCILSEHLRNEKLSEGDLIAITPAGHVHLELAHRDVHYLAACLEDTWLANEALAEEIRRRMSIAPYWKALSWPITLDSAYDLVNYLIDQQEKSLTSEAHYLRETSSKNWTIDLEAVRKDVVREKQRQMEVAAAKRDHRGV